jgi:uncharacterized protein (TIGR03118 family)
VVATDAGAVYKGLAIAGDRLYAADFGACRVAVFDGTFAAASTSGGFHDHGIPADYCPFGIQVIGDTVFVSYAKRDGVEDVPGRGHGFVRAFDLDGHRVAEVASRGALDSPWGIAMAPGDFGRFSGCLLIGNFGNGRINAYCREHARYRFEGALRDNHRALVVDGLWGIGFGNGTGSGPTNVLYFAAGPDEEANGLFGKIAVSSEVCHR